MPLERFFLLGGDRRQACLAALLRKQFSVFCSQVPGAEELLPQEPCHIVLPCPSFAADGKIRGSSLTAVDLKPYLTDNITVFTGLPGAFAKQLAPARVVDLLADEAAVWENARLTAEAALLLVQDKTAQSLFRRCCAVVGFGRIGKLLSVKLLQAGAYVTVLARKEADRALARALGLQAAPGLPENTELVFNTVPAQTLSHIPAGCLWIELASAPGGLPEGASCLSGAALPGRLLPVSAAAALYAAILRALER